MKTFLFPLAVVSTVAVLGIATLGIISALGQKRQASTSVPSLPAYGVDIQQTSVSGMSSGGAMAVQMHVAHSAIMRGVGVIAGVAYDCADSSLQFVGWRLERGIEMCMPGLVDAALSIARTAAAAGIAGAIDDPANLARQKVWLFSGYNDGTVRRAAMNALAAYYEHYVDAGNIFYKTNSRAPHALVTDGYGGQCLGVNPDHINNCNYDSAGRLLEHIYGHLTQPGSDGSTGSLLAFDQSEFVNGDPHAVGLADTGYVYVPTACSNEPCRVHVVFHGCKQYAGKVGDAVYRHGGYNKWAAANKLVVLYPQTTDAPFNPNGCWDWWGLSDLLALNHNYAQKTGYQISAVKSMLDRLAQGFVPRPSSDTFGTPQDFRSADSTSSSVALSWRPNSAAAGFNIYRSLNSAGPFTKITSQPLSGASFADRSVQPNSAYYYQSRAVDQFGQESPPTSAMPGTTAPEPPACDPYFSNNVIHVMKLRAFADVLDDTWAAGSVEWMGRYDVNESSQLIKERPAYYRVGYCP
jgi:poly(3-hydroxybutyrate) depolymerase